MTTIGSNKFRINTNPTIYAKPFSYFKTYYFFRKINSFYKISVMNMESELFNFDIIKPIIVNLLSKFDKKIMTTIGSTGGRNILGRVCIFHRGGGKKRLYRPIDFIRRVNDYGTVIKIYKAAKRTAFIGTILYLNGLLSNLLMAENSRIGSLLFNGTYIPKEYAAKDAHG
jgi:hypothetical protein